MKICICNAKSEEIKLATISKEKSKRNSKNSRDKENDKEPETTEKRVANFVKHFNSPKSDFNIYILPHFCGDVSLFQIYVNILDKEKKKRFLGIIPRKTNRVKSIEDILDSTAGDFCYKAVNKSNSHYLRFLHKHTEAAYNEQNNCVLSLHPLNLKHFFRTSSKTIIGESTRIENFLLHSSCESFMEFGITYNNNLLMPLLNAITENNLENMGKLSEIIYNTIFNFNAFLENYPEYKQYLLRHTEFNTGLQQTYLKVYEQHKLFTLVEYIDHMFIEHPPLFFFIKFYQLVIQKCNIDLKMFRKPANNDSKY